MTSPASGRVARPAWQDRVGTGLEQGANYQASAEWLQNLEIGTNMMHSHR